jgi:hypothetical protein
VQRACLVDGHGSFTGCGGLRFYPLRAIAFGIARRELATLDFAQQYVITLRNWRR